MPASARQSRCCTPSSNQFYWNGLPALVGGDATAWLADEVLRILKLDPSRRWTPWNEPLIRAEVAGLIETGKIGGLTPVKHVKEIERAPREYIFEIRFSNQVSRVDSKGRAGFDTAQSRSYHTEPAHIPDVFIGLHVHEKAIVKGDGRRTQELQDVEIDIAVQAFERGEPHNWGL